MNRLLVTRIQNFVFNVRNEISQGKGKTYVFNPITKRFYATARGTGTGLFQTPMFVTGALEKVLMNALAYVQEGTTAKYSIKMEGMIVHVQREEF